MAYALALEVVARMASQWGTALKHERVLDGRGVGDGLLDVFEHFAGGVADQFFPAMAGPLPRAAGSGLGIEPAEHEDVFVDVAARLGDNIEALLVGNLHVWRRCFGTGLASLRRSRCFREGDCSLGQ